MANAEKGDERYIVPNVERALMILEHLAKSSQGLGVSDLADQLDVPKNSVFRIVSTLLAGGYLKRDDASKQYVLGSKLLSLGYAAVHEGHLVEKSLEVMRQVRDETDETTVVGIFDGLEGIVLEQELSPQQVKVTLGVGTRFPLHTAAPGKAMLAALPEVERLEHLGRMEFPRFTDNTITSEEAMRAEVEEAARCGYAVDNGEHNVGIRCVGAAVLNQRKAVVGAIWITGPSFRIPIEEFRHYGEIVRAGAIRISRRFGYDG